MKKTIQVKCPECSEQFSYYTSEHRPFCSDRCRMIDMGQWLNGTYAVPGRDGSVYIENQEVGTDDEDI